MAFNVILITMIKNFRNITTNNGLMVYQINCTRLCDKLKSLGSNLIRLYFNIFQPVEVTVRPVVCQDTAFLVAVLKVTDSTVIKRHV